MISFIGYETQLVKVQPVMKVALQASTHELDEVMVVAFGTAKKSQFTGSASTIKADKIAVRQTSNVTNALSGQVAGVQITSSNGEPGSKATVRIRGIGSMSASNDPLYVVDGVPFDGGIETINPQDIESMTVLKDAASNALYGARGANGVILITTKKGQMGSKTRVDVDAKWGTNRRATRLSIRVSTMRWVVLMLRQWARMCKVSWHIRFIMCLKDRICLQKRVRSIRTLRWVRYITMIII